MGGIVTWTVRGGGRRWAIVLLDALAAAVMLRLAVLLRFDGEVPAAWEAGLPVATALLVAARVGFNVAAGLHVWSFWMAGLPDALRVVAAGAGGSLVFAPLAGWALGTPASRAVLALEFFLTTAAFGALRFAPRVARRWYGARRRRRGGASATLVVGVNATAEALARDVARDPRAPYHVVGFVSTSAREVGTRLDGRPVLGVLDDLPELVLRHRVGMLLLALPRQPAARLREIVSTCARCRVGFRIVSATLDEGGAPVSAAMLDELAPEDLLLRPPVRFDERELRALVAGRRALVTGAGGSIGSEVCRQLVRYGARQLVMVDLNENELYLAARRLAAEHPEVDVRAEVADVREEGRLLRLGLAHRPGCVVHAAAHKHVPLMEDAPEEAVKNNVFGTLHAARMADACGADSFVLVSTDKAVNPSSVMGATKRVAELVVRDLAQRSATRMTAVRFGNVLGSAGSVLPLFKQQIARGGPVTVTHPDCTRYFMSIPEAVGLVLLAGLGHAGDLCVLDMGDPVRVDDLARLTIALAGKVPGVDIELAYTGLRPGEKLAEELLTEEEERTREVRERIRIAQSPAPPPGLELRLAELRRLAEAGDREGILRALRTLVPTFRADRGAARAGARAAAGGVSPAVAVAAAHGRPAAAARPLGEPGLPAMPGVGPVLF